ncbi:hypothetical protein CTheo_9161 [Ceratobasidium theobromae]|uniref:Uncharacterized protein n=1 Tax=Ceratobasidium theobromae TaxID=1582974 RepID=A0A5N5Q7I7_9AGAM|nr:hypothetical protein CTheo_9161 [Ceratobasidium theobromae]
MQEFLLDIAHLDADHSGAGMGQKVFKSLDYMGAARNVIASVTDNASNNQTLNTELSAQLSKKYGYQLNINQMSIVCLCHALHLICSAILSNLKAMDPFDHDDQYAIVKSFEDGEIFEQSAEVLEEEERLRCEGNEPDTHMGSMEVSDEESDGAEAESQPNDSIGFGSQPIPNSIHNELNCVQKASSTKFCL